MKFKICDTLPKIFEHGETMWLSDQRRQSFRLAHRGFLMRTGEEGFLRLVRGKGCNLQFDDDLGDVVGPVRASVIDSRMSAMPCLVDVDRLWHHCFSWGTIIRKHSYGSS
jgi:hypothetical protein